MKYLLSICISFFFIESIYSQHNPIKFKHLSTNDGLSNNWVRCIYKDDFGFMWFGTADGLSRFDGHEFKVYRPKTIKGKSQGDINISDIYEKDKYELWVCTDLGVYVYNYLDDDLHPFSPIRSVVALSVLVDKEKNVWFGTNQGLYKYIQGSTNAIHYYHNPGISSSLSNSYVNTIFEDSEANLWVGTKGGLNLYHKKNDSFIRCNPNDLLIGISTDDVLSICQDKNKRIWIGYAQDGLYVINNYSFESVKLRKVIDGRIIKLLVDNKNFLWVGKGSGEGLGRIDLNKFSDKTKPIFEHFQNEWQNISSLSDNSIYSLFQDNFNDIWIGTFGNGINYYSGRAKKFDVVNVKINEKKSIKNNLVNAIIEDEQYIYVGTEGGLDLYNKTKDSFTHFENQGYNLNSIAANPIYSMYKDRKGNLWVGTWAGGLNLFNPSAGTFKRFLPGEKQGSISNANIFSICDDDRGNLWIGTIGGGLNKYNYMTGKFTVYKHDKNNPKSIYADLINSIFQTSSGELYISTYNSLDLYDYDNDNFKHFAHNSSDTTKDFGSILSIFEDSKKNMWIGTNSGLECFNEKTALFSSYTINNGLPDNTIQAILEDTHGNLWISTNNGIFKFVNAINNPKQPIIYKYTIDDGLSGNGFKKRSAFKNKDGLMYFGSSEGYTYFHPDSIKQNPFPPEVILSGFSFLNSSPNDNLAKVTKGINFIDELKLDYSHSDFTISFAALNYLNPQNNLFKYMLDGYDSQWINAGDQQSATYTNLNPGTYTFLVMASNNDGVWCKSPKTIKIIIYPPWWKTLIFRIIIVFLILFLFVSFYNIRIRILENQKKILEDTVQQRTNELTEINITLEEKQEEIIVQNHELMMHKDHLELLVDERTSELKTAKEKAELSDRLKSAFLQNMSHEVRTPLNAIMGFASILEKYFDQKEELIKFADIINQKGNDLLEIIDGILNIAKIESGSLSISSEKCDLVELLLEVQGYFIEYQKRFHKEHIQFVLNTLKNTSDTTINIDRGKLKQILIHLIGNAFKFTSFGKVEVGYNFEGSDILNFYISDTGIGIPKEKYELIFEKFRQVDELDYHIGTGLGLSVTKGLIQLFGGNIWFTSELNKGTTFYFTIPLVAEQKESDLISSKDFDFTNKTIIIAEDDYVSFLYLKELFRNFKVNIIHVENGQVLMNKLENLKPDLILLDINMPIKSGLECLEEIRSKGLDTKIIVQTAYAQGFEKDKYFKAGCNGYLAKPVRRDDLFEVISKVFSVK